ncbi:MAG: class I SAM-dependent methyltransferase [Anaerolineae bacterium]
MTRICDYEGSTYRTDFWEGQDRRYEDLAERIALRHLLPPQGQRLVEIGAGFGRLANLYGGYEQIIIQDYARTQVEEAQRYLGRDPRYLFVVADLYRLPFVDNLFDTVTMVRVMHHLADVPAALAELHRIARPQGIAIVEHASKLHLKAIARWLLRRQRWNPFDPSPVEFVEMNFNFHPAWMRQQVGRSGFAIEATRTVSHYRIPLLKKMFPAPFLARLDGWAQASGRWWQLTPSVFLRARARKAADAAPAAGFFRCPECHCPDLARQGEVLLCQGCQRCWSARDGIYDFKTPLA